MTEHNPIIPSASGPKPPASVIVVPTYNERENIVKMLPALAAAAPESDVLIVDDNSPDGTADAVRADARFGGRVNLLSRPGKQGLGRAYQAGFEWTLARGYERIVQMDADFSHDPRDVPRLLAACERADMAIGSRYVPRGRVEGWPPHRWLISRGANAYSRFMLGLPVCDVTAGFRCWRASALRAVDLPTLAAAGYVFQVELTARATRAGLRIREVPIVFRERLVGVTKMSAWVAIEGLLRVLCMFLAGEPAGGAAADRRFQPRA